MPLASVSAHTFPYIKTYGGDVSAGGWFGSNCIGSQYQDPNYVSSGGSTSNSTGGILTYSFTGSSIKPFDGGSSSQYGAIALGDIARNRLHTTDTLDSPIGFYSSGANKFDGSINVLGFANINSLAGQFNGSTRNASQCIPDYFGMYSPTNNPTTITPDAGHQQDFLAPMAADGSCPANGVYYIDATRLSGAYYNLNQDQARDICDSSNIAVIVKGNVRITNDIHYQSDSQNVSKVPKFVLVVEGNIYLDSSVGHLDGWYVAQTDPTKTVADDSGVVWDCFPDGTTGTSVDASFISQNCRHPLVVTGSITAKHINLLRSGGDVNNYDDNETPGPCLDTGLSSPQCDEDMNFLTKLIPNCDQAAPTDCSVSEIFNYSPMVVIGGGFFNKGSGSLTAGAQIESLVSLPPVF